MKLPDGLEYNPTTGEFSWLKTGRGRKREVAGWKDPRDGYIRLEIGGRSYLAHRVAWFITYGKFPKGLLDHKNLKRDDNRIDNLRMANRAQNAHHARVRKDSASGLKGVNFHKTQKQWRARLTINGRQILIGWFSSKEEAHAAYCAAARNHFGEFFTSGNTDVQ